jgi:hypothetical protein
LTLAKALYPSLVKFIFTFMRGVIGLKAKPYFSWPSHGQKDSMSEDIVMINQLSFCHLPELFWRHISD